MDDLESLSQSFSNLKTEVAALKAALDETIKINETQNSQITSLIDQNTKTIKRNKQRNNRISLLLAAGFVSLTLLVIKSDINSDIGSRLAEKLIDNSFEFAALLLTSSAGVMALSSANKSQENEDKDEE